MLGKAVVGTLQITVFPNTRLIIAVEFYYTYVSLRTGKEQHQFKPAKVRLMVFGEQFFQ